MPDYKSGSNTHYDDKQGHLRAKTSEPIIIKNRALGYRIFQDLEDFDYFDGTVYFGGSTRFEYLKTSTIAVTTQGWVIEQRGFVVEGYLSTDRLGTMLPPDWKEL